MAEIEVRQATLDDAQAISRLFRSSIQVWQRLDDRGRVEDVPYDALTIYERWLHGGPWMSVETAAIQLSHLLLGAGLALVATRGGEPLAYAEAYHGVEPPPFGAHVHMAHLVVDPERQGQGLEDALIDGLLARTAALKAKALTISRIATGEDDGLFHQRYTLTPLARLRRVSISARTGQIFFKATEQPNADPAQIAGWYMPVGRLTSARQEWETRWPRLWDVLPELQQQRKHRIHVNVAGQEALICSQQQLYDPRSADMYCWSPRPLSPQLLTVMRDWAHHEGYRTLVMVVSEETLKTIGSEGEPDAYVQDVCAVSRLED